MVKKRIIFTLLFSEGYFWLSRNFRLQKVGDIHWLNRHYDFQNIAFSIDELIILNTSREDKHFKLYYEYIRELGDQCFIPIAAGGGIRNLENAQMLLESGADKIVVNSVLEEDTSFVKKLVSYYGSQCVVGSIDFKKIGDNFKALINNGTIEVPLSFEAYFKKVCELGVGEIYLNSIDKDGTGQGYIMEILNIISHINIPIILAGGAGNSKHLLEGLGHSNVDAVATANLFNFVGNGLPTARNELMKQGIILAEWSQRKERELSNYFNNIS